MQQNKRGPRRRIGRGKRWLFGLVLLACGAALVVVVEGVLRLLPAPFVEDPFLHTVYPVAYRSIVHRDGGDFIKVTLPDIPHIDTDQIPVRRDPEVFRIFCVGESASAGFPHPRAETYSAYLRHWLELAYPGRRFEMVDWSAHAYPHYLVRLVLMHMIDEQPDLVIIFTGNNQTMLNPVYPIDPGLGERARWALVRTRVAKWMQFGLTRMLAEPPVDKGDPLARNRASVRILQGLPTHLQRDPAQYAQMLRHFRYSLREMIGACRERNIPALVLTSPVNLRDWRPLVTTAGNNPDRWAEWRDRLRVAREANRGGDGAATVEALQQALAIKPDHAATHFALGKTYLKLGRVDAAREAFQKANDLDERPVRATSDANAIVREVAAEFDNAALVDLERAFPEHTPDGIPGNDLFTDNVHFNRAANLIVAQEVFKAVAGRLPGTAAFPPFPEIPPMRLQNGEPYRLEDDIVGLSLLFWINSFMNQYQRLEADSQQILDLQKRHAGFTPDPRGASIPAAFVEHALIFGAAMREAGVQDDPLYPLFPEDYPELEKQRLDFYRLY